MKTTLLFFLAGIGFASCNSGSPVVQDVAQTPILGTWQLISNKIITKGDTVIAFPVKGSDEIMIKMYNDTHFSFFRHDLKKGKSASPVYDTGAGTYQLNGTDYAEHLQYCNYREWEDHKFTFKLSIQNDTLVQRGVEKIDSLNVNREIIETYIRVK